jgi:hypothetical protein
MHSFVQTPVPIDTSLACLKIAAAPYTYHAAWLKKIIQANL